MFEIREAAASPRILLIPGRSHREMLDLMAVTGPRRPSPAFTEQRIITLDASGKNEASMAKCARLREPPIRPVWRLNSRQFRDLTQAGSSFRL